MMERSFEYLKARVGSSGTPITDEVLAAIKSSAS
jgi:hypothetical protein